MAAEWVEIEVPSFDGGAPAFLEWAGAAADVRLHYSPDPILAVDEPGRRGYFADDVYLAVAWVAEGGDELLQALHDHGVTATSSTHTTSHRELLTSLTTSGSPVPFRFP